MNPAALNVVLVDPEIPPNTGNIARTCAATKLSLHLVGSLGFQLTDRHLKRAGLDYWEHVDLHYHTDFATLVAGQPQARFIYTSARRGQILWDFAFAQGDWLVFGSESRGLPQNLLGPEQSVVTVPVYGQVRSLNLANAVAVVVYEALRQLQTGPSLPS
ncbi:MAG: tRNA (cytidine(34)-2'-O)-methyltransferase [Gemmatimonadaceae bacterium]|nr:tRNA (cytidine(34)-2'-O)-methyltransferase [Gloeobacterales cyanobacterium ES-bin-141]